MAPDEEERTSTEDDGEEHELGDEGMGQGDSPPQGEDMPQGPSE